MLTANDLSVIDSARFQIIDSNEARVVLCSFCTGHYWCLLERAANGCRSFQIRHRHGSSGPYHIQVYRPSIEACCAYIKDHDAFHIEREMAKQKKRDQSIKRRKAVRHAAQKG